MADNNFPTISDIKNIGVRNMADEKLGSIKRFVLTQPNFTFATETDALDLTDWIAGIVAPIATRIFPSPTLGPEVPTRNNDGAKYHEGALGSIFISEGVITYEMTCYITTKVFQKMRTQSNKKWRVFFLDTMNNIIGVKKTTTVYGFELDRYNVEDLVETDSSGTATLARITMRFADTREYLDDRILIKPALKDSDSWLPLTSLYSLEDVNLSVSDQAITGFTITTLIDGTTDIGVIGLAAADLTLVDAATPTVPVSKTITDNGDGTYAVAATLVAGHTYPVNLVSAASLTIPGYESLASASVVIPGE